MKKNHHSHSNSKEMNRNTAILIAAIIFFLLGLVAFAKAAGTDIFESVGLPSPFGTRTGTTNSTQNRTLPGGQGGTGNGANNGSNGGNGSGNGLLNPADDLDVNVKTDTGVDLDAGIDEGQLYVDPQLNPNPQGGTGAEGSVNEKKVIDTDSILR